MYHKMYAKASMIVHKSCRKPKINFIVPPLGRMNTNVKYCGGLQTRTVVRSVAIECKHGDAFDNIFQEIARYLSQINLFK